MNEQKIRRYALENAVKYDGKANPGAVIGKLFSEEKELDRKQASIKVNEIVKEVNRLGVEKQEEILREIAPDFFKKKKKEEKQLPELKDAKKVVMRFEPSPSGPMHIGHAYVLGLNHAFCSKYNGRMILRIGDTNPGNIYEPAYSLLEEDARWLTKDGISEVIVQSERLELYYRYMEKLIDVGKAYICDCDPEEYKRLSRESIACPCRGLSAKEQKQRWKRMFSGYKQGEAVARIKTDLNNKNPAMRDFPVFRISEIRHAKQGNRYRVWPLMNMAVAADDIELGCTHIIRAKDHHDNAMRQRYIYDYLGKRFPEAIFVGRINFEGMPVSSTKTRHAIEEGKYSGWDDIRLPFLQALKRRGYRPDAFLRYAVDVGVSLTDKKVTKEEFFKMIDAFNRDAVDAEAYRYFFIWNPVKIKIKGAPKQDVELDLHPDNKKGGRKFKVRGEFFITKEDMDSIKENELCRLMDCLNFRKTDRGFVFDSLSYEEFRNKGRKIMHWLPADRFAEIAVLMPDKKTIGGYAEKTLDNIGEVVQLERFGFCRIDKKNKLWFCHK